MQVAGPNPNTVWKDDSPPKYGTWAARRVGLVLGALSPGTGRRFGQSTWRRSSDAHFWMKVDALRGEKIAHNVGPRSAAILRVDRQKVFRGARNQKKCAGQISPAAPKKHRPTFGHQTCNPLVKPWNSSYSNMSGDLPSLHLTCAFRFSAGLRALASCVHWQSRVQNLANPFHFGR